MHRRIKVHKFCFNTSDELSFFCFDERSLPFPFPFVQSITGNPTRKKEQFENKGLRGTVDWNRSWLTLICISKKAGLSSSSNKSVEGIIFLCIFVWIRVRVRVVLLPPPIKRKSTSETRRCFFAHNSSHFGVTISMCEHLFAWMNFSPSGFSAIKCEVFWVTRSRRYLQARLNRLWEQEGWQASSASSRRCWDYLTFHPEPPLDCAALLSLMLLGLLSKYTHLLGSHFFHFYRPLQYRRCFPMFFSFSMQVYSFDSAARVLGITSSIIQQ